MDAKILSIGTAVPPNRYSQKEIYELLKNRFRENPATEKMFAHPGIGFRHSVLSNEVFQVSGKGDWPTSKRNALYAEEAPKLAAKAIENCLNKAGVLPKDIRSIIVVTCTGCITPGLDIILAARFGMPATLKRLHIGGMGCYASFPAMKAARDATGNSSDLVLLVSVELCTLHLQPNSEMNNLVSASLFADGAAAVLIGEKTGNETAPVILETFNQTDYETQEDMTWNVGDHGFVMTLSPKVPPFIGARIGEFVKTLIARNHLNVGDIHHWVVHPGGPRILDEVQNNLSLSDSQMSYSRNILKEYGNMSSATVFFILEKIQEEAKPQKGEYGIMLGFGPGLTMEGSLIRWK